MDKEQHNKKMISVYEHIYQDRYRFKPNEIKDAEDLMKKNLKELNIDLEYLNRSTILNVGTGRETIVLHNMGAKKCLHIDISPIPVQNLNDYCINNQIDSIHSLVGDFCATEFPYDEQVDLAYLSGVFHHFHNPVQCIKNLSRILAPGSKIFFRLYLSGTLRFFVADYVRRFFISDDIKEFEKIYRDFLGDFPKDEDESHHNVLAQLYNMICDDVFVPVLNLYSPNELYRYFENHGFVGFNKPNLPNYNHDNHDKASIAYSAFFELKQRDEKGDVWESFPESVNQLEINYFEEHINKTVKMMISALPTLKNLDFKTRSVVAIKLFYTAQVYRLSKHYDDKVYLERDPEIKKFQTSKYIHNEFQNVLAPFVT